MGHILTSPLYYVTILYKSPPTMITMKNGRVLPLQKKGREGEGSLTSTKRGEGRSLAILKGES